MEAEKKFTSRTYRAGSLKINPKKPLTIDKPKILIATNHPIKSNQDLFKKAIVLVGAPSTGKTMLADLFCQGKKTATVSGRNNISKDKFFYRNCFIDTEIIHIDDLNLKKNSLEEFFADITEGVKVNKPRKESFLIKPQFIITIDCKLEDIPDYGSFVGRFDVFELKGCNGTKPTYQ